MWTVEVKHIPRNARRMCHVLREPRAHDALLIPEMLNSSIRQRGRVPPQAAIAAQYLKPHHVQPPLRLWMPGEEFLLYPTGTCNTLASGRREQQDQPWGTRALVEARL